MASFLVGCGINHSQLEIGQIERQFSVLAVEIIYDVT